MSRISIVAVAAALIMAAPAFASQVYPNKALQNPVPPGKNNKHKGGVVAADGSIITGMGFSVSHDATGRYTIDVPAGFFTSTCPVILVTPAGYTSEFPIVNDYDYITCGGGGEVKMQIRMWGRKDGAPQDNAFHFFMSEP
jgi:hypothetical protein